MARQALLFLLRHDLQSQVQHGVGIADKIAAARKNHVQVVVQFQAAADVEGEVGAAVGDGGCVAEELDPKAQSIVDFALQDRACVPIALLAEGGLQPVTDVAV